MKNRRRFGYAQEPQQEGTPGRSASSRHPYTTWGRKCPSRDRPLARRRAEGLSNQVVLRRGPGAPRHPPARSSGALGRYLFSQREGVVGLHRHGQDSLVPVDDGVGHGSDGRVPDLQTDAGNVANALRGERLVSLRS